MKFSYKNTSLYHLYNLHDEKAQGRSVMLASTVISSIISWLTGSLFYTSFLMYNGIDLVKIGIISFVPYIANCFAVFAPSILERFQRRRWVLFAGRLVYYVLAIFGTTIMPFFVEDPDMRTVFFAILTFAASIVNALFAGGYSAWHLNFIPNEVRAEYFSTSSMISSFISLATALTSSLVADAFSASPYAYTIIIILRLVAFALALLELFFLLKPVEYPYPKSNDKVRFSDIFTKPFTHPKFMWTLLLIGLTTFFTNTSASSISYYLLNNVGITYTFNFSLSMLYPFFILFLLKPVNRLIQKHGWFPMYGLGAILYAIPSFVYSFVTSANYLWLMSLVRISQHITGVLYNTASSNIPYINMPDTDRVSYLAFYSIFINALAFAGVLFGTWFVGTFPDLDLVFGSLHFCNMQVLMWVESLGRALVGILVFSMMRNIRPDEE